MSGEYKKFNITKREIDEREFKHEKKIIYRGKMIDIVSSDYNGTIGYHFKIIDKCNKKNAIYSCPFKDIKDAINGSYAVIKQGHI